jgi:cell division septum initiation protein DivIVA
VSRKDRLRQSRTPAREAAERIERVVEAAERAAETVIDDAERRAHKYLEEAEAEADRVVSQRLASLSGVTDILLEQAEATRRQTERLLAALEQAKAELGGTDLPTPAGESPQERVSHLTAVAEPEEPQPEVGYGTPAGARLLATQMAVSGNSREEIELRLRNGFEIDDTTAILDAILGPEE